MDRQQELMIKFLLLSFSSTFLFICDTTRSWSSAGYCFSPQFSLTLTIHYSSWSHSASNYQISCMCCNLNCTPGQLIYSFRFKTPSSPSSFYLINLIGTLDRITTLLISLSLPEITCSFSCDLCGCERIERRERKKTTM